MDNDQQEQKPKKSTVDRINDWANRGKSAYKWGQRARHPIQTFNAARAAMGIGQAAQQGATLTGAAAGSSAAGSTAGTAGASTIAAGTTSALGAGLLTIAIIFFIIFLVAFIIIFPPFAGVGESAPIPPGGGGNGGNVQINLSCNLPPAGPPSGNGSDCPIRGGQVTCGSYCASGGGCGHCTPAYLASYPENTNICANSDTGTRFGLDIGAPNGTEIILPRINGKTISYSLIDQANTGNGFIQYYDGLDSSTGTLYRLQLHHTSSGSGKSGVSGDRGGIIGALRHVHVQLALRKATGLEWVDAPLWFCN